MFDFNGNSFSDLNPNGASNVGLGRVIGEGISQGVFHADGMFMRCLAAVTFNM